MKISMNMGFVTNSSSVVHHFPKEVLKDPRVQAFLEAFEVQDGFVGVNLWRRSECTTIALTKDQKRKVQDELNNNECESRGLSINAESDEIVIIYGDEYSSIASSLVHLMSEAMAAIHGGDAWKYRNGVNYN